VDRVFSTLYEFRLDTDLVIEKYMALCQTCPELAGGVRTSNTSNNTCRL
jgi:hypothetical protein